MPFFSVNDDAASLFDSLVGKGTFLRNRAIEGSVEDQIEYDEVGALHRGCDAPRWKFNMFLRKRSS
ncbi:hypothetical protein GCM10008018_40120 [Paenibacillus marchantiophytorum]|uniref:Uncharacterized protein n=1 Tax=Paenibacillus marchantiophytorum TaxID=1619310 RepID=A0ABQ1EVZ1_9BACL|nr:hypothetical protein GCM10008018_40120 [Paenibacillus marchantiophytorum]